ncbi:Protein FAR1-RELATED SEQUENCE 11 [Bienertia sinuspersici]
MPCAIFVGINNHGKTIFYGCPLLRNETIDTFKWLMKLVVVDSNYSRLFTRSNLFNCTCKFFFIQNFVATMKKPPKTIIIDQDPWMRQFIAQELPYTKHCFCIWPITSKFSTWFTFILRLETIEEFENQWPLVVGRYNLLDNKHVKGLYQIKEFWAPTYLRSYYFGGMRTTGTYENLKKNAVEQVRVQSWLMKDMISWSDIMLMKIVDVTRSYGMGTLQCALASNMSSWELSVSTF